MPKVIAAFGEDFAHRSVVGALITRVSNELNVPVEVDWRSARRGYGKVVEEVSSYLRDLRNQNRHLDLVVIATDANCKGLVERTRQIPTTESPVPVVLAIPDPHIERWLLVDGAAFKSAMGQGCPAPDQKCSRDRYKEMLIRAIASAGVVPSLGGIEFAEDIIAAMNLDRAGQADASLRRFLENLRQALKLNTDL